MKKRFFNRKLMLISVLMMLMVGITAVVYAADVTIDDFNENPATSDDTQTSSCTQLSTGTGANILGGERDILLTQTNGSQYVRYSSGGTDGRFGFSIDAGTRGTALIQWDGADADCTNANGLGPVDLTGSATNDGFDVYVYQVDQNAVVTITAYDNGGTIATFSRTIADSIASPGHSIFLPFELFSNQGTFNWGQVTAVELLIDGTTVDSIDMVIDYLTVTATRDFGDLPSAYDSVTTVANNGARHIVSPTYFGTVATDFDPEIVSQSTATANGDDTDGNNDELGLDPVIGSDWGDGGGEIDVDVISDVGGACVVGFIDWDGSGSFDSGGTTGLISELVYNDALADGSNTTIAIVTPNRTDYAGGNYPAVLNARFRIFAPLDPLFTELGIELNTGFGGNGCPEAIGSGNTEAEMLQLVTGLAYSGEVEDHQWGFSPTAVSLQSFSTNSTSTLPAVGLVVFALLAIVGTGVALTRRQRA